MSYLRLAYDDQDTAVQMHDDCTACAAAMSPPQQRVDLEDVRQPAPALDYDAFPHPVAKPVIEVSEAAAHLASLLHLHLD